MQPVRPSYLLYRAGQRYVSFSNLWCVPGRSLLVYIVWGHFRTLASCISPLVHDDDIDDDVNKEMQCM